MFENKRFGLLQFCATDAIEWEEKQKVSKKKENCRSFRIGAIVFPMELCKAIKDMEKKVYISTGIYTNPSHMYDGKSAEPFMANFLLEGKVFSVSIGFAQRHANRYRKRKHLSIEYIHTQIARLRNVKKNKNGKEENCIEYIK